jgi:putative transposase
LIEVNPKNIISISEQCNLLELARSSYYYKPSEETPLNLELMKMLDKQYLECPFYGRSKHTEELRKKGYLVNHKRVCRLMKKLGIIARAPGPHTSRGNSQHEKYPYLLKGMEIDRTNQVWATDITWIPTVEGSLYLVAVLDIFSRFIVSWKLSNSLEVDFCIEALKEALKFGKPEIFNSDQGSQFTANAFVEILKENQIRISMDGKGRYSDNIFVERFWRSLKYEEVYPREYETGEEAYNGISSYMDYYNEKRMHQALLYSTPAEVFYRDVI